jgi:hypothetical protein
MPARRWSSMAGWARSNRAIEFILSERFRGSSWWNSRGKGTTAHCAKN